MINYISTEDISMLYQSVLLQTTPKILILQTNLSMPITKTANPRSPKSEQNDFL